MPLGLRDPRSAPVDHPKRGDRAVFQLADNGAVLYSDETDRLFRSLLAQHVRLPGDADWLTLLGRLNTERFSVASQLLGHAALRWCETLAEFVELWTLDLAGRPLLVNGYLETALDLLERVEATYEKLIAWRMVPPGGDPGGPDVVGRPETRGEEGR